MSTRVAKALRDLRELDGSAADQYLRELRRSDPEVAQGLNVLLWVQGSEFGERPAPFRDPGAERTRTEDPPPAPEGRAPADARTTASIADPGPPGNGRAARPLAGPIIGRYQLLRVAGRGAFGEVWRAYDPVLQKDVAVKVPLPRSSGRPPSPSAVLREARRAASLRHPAIVQVHDAGECEGVWYIVSEFVEGPSLRARMKTGRLPLDRAARIVATVAGALHAAHLAGLIHRDVKPANILLDRAGTAYLTDFGLAVREDEQSAERNKVSGTLAYMPPEQLRGDTHLMDGRADVYALGAVLYELLTGRVPFRAETDAEHLELVLRQEPRPPRAIAPVPEELERICLKCLAKEVKDRYRTAQDLAADLELWLGGAARSAPPPAVRLEPVPRWVRPTVIGAFALSLVAAVVGATALGDRPPSGRPEATRPGPRPVPGRAVPLVKDLLGLKNNGGPDWQVLPDGKQLMVYARSVALLQLGETDAADWTFSVDLSQFRTKDAGLFLGHRIDPVTRVAGFEIIYLVALDGKTELRRQVCTYRLDEPFVGFRTDICQFIPLGEPLPENVFNTFRLVVRAGQLQEVRINGKAVPEPVSDPKRSAAGAFGVCNQFSEGVYKRPRFNDADVPFVTEVQP